MSGDEVTEELEALEAILEETIEIVSSTNNRPTDLAIQINPLTASEQEKQYVSLTLNVYLPPEYPGCPPKLEVRNPRGLEDGAVAGLLSDMNARCEEYQGCPVLFELIELAREFLTTRNVPVCQCIICLNNIQENDEFTKTECLHFFHKRCLGRYITNVQETCEAERAEAAINNKGSTPKELELVCPVCREGINQYKYNLAELMLAPPPVLEPTEEIYTVDPNIRKMQEQMKSLYIKQKNKGGIIDVEAEEKKYLILTNHGEENNSFAELSPTDYQLDVCGFPMGQLSSGGDSIQPDEEPTLGASPRRPEDQTPTRSRRPEDQNMASERDNSLQEGENRKEDPETSFVQEEVSTKKTNEYSKRTEVKGGIISKHKGKGGKNKQGSPKLAEMPSKASLEEKESNSLPEKESRDRNSYRKNHYQNRGKSYNQQKKIKGTRVSTEKL